MSPQPRLFRIETVALCLMTACVCPGDPPPILCDFPTTCVDTTCCEFVSESFCAPCPRGTEPAGMCSPAIACGDGGVPRDGDIPPRDAGDSGTGCGAVDAGPICQRIDDPCCASEARYPRLGPDCSLSCEPGYGFAPDACVPEPSCEPSTECDEPGECTTTFETCCGTCSEVGLDDVVGIRVDGERAYRDAICEDTACPPCAPPPHPYLVATCNARQCRALDTRALPLAQCTADEQCRMRATECCECGADTSPEALIGIRIDAEADYLDLVCDSDAICDDCAPIYPDTHEAFCNDVGRCAVRPIGDGD